MSRGRAHRTASAVICAVAIAACDAPTVNPDAQALTGGQWQTVTLPFGPRLEPGVTSLGQLLVVLGGFSSDPAAGSMIATEIDTLDTAVPMTEWTWTPLTPAAPVAWTHLQLVGIDSTLYLLGGMAGSDLEPQGQAFALDPGATAWRPLRSMPAGQERGAAGIVVSPPHVYLLGGQRSAGALATSLDYDLLADTWTLVPVDLPSPRAHSAAMQRGDGALIVIGGVATLDATEPIADVLDLGIGSDAWEPLAPMPTARGDCAYGILEGQLMCAGGEAGTAALQVVESYNPFANQWTTLPALPMPRAGTQGASIGGLLFVPGGATSLAVEPTDTMDVFTPY